MKACLIHEFPLQVDFQRLSVYQKLIEQYPNTKFCHLHGFLHQYIEGGIHPLRLLNMAWMFLKTPLMLLISRPNWILCCTAPPGIQVWASLWGNLLKIPTVAWIYDYHPEIEVRALEKSTFLKPLAKWIRWLDHKSQQSLQGVIVLDEAMASLFRKVNPRAKVQIHPTWNQYLDQKKSPENKTTEGKITLSYAGNLGTKHPLHLLRKLLITLSEKSPNKHIALNVISSNEKVRERFREFGANLKVNLQFHDRQDTLQELSEKLNQLETDYGIILMEEEAHGLLSPSKYSGYLYSGLPLLYCGPRQTNADAICRKFDAGIAITSTESTADMEEIANSILSTAQRNQHKAAARKAYQHYSSFDSCSFLSVLCSIIDPSSGAEAQKP